MIVTFYSFKGGVGRSMAVANVAELLARRGLAVLLVDFDLEAPGLERFFDVDDAVTSPEEIEGHRGVVDLIVSYKELRSLPLLQEEPPDPSPARESFPYPVEPLRNFVAPVLETPLGGSLAVMPAGRRAGDDYGRYADQIRAFDWDEFYARWDGEAFFEWFRREAESLADVVIIDSRTGITELSGVSTFQLADVVVMCVAPNEQNLAGCELIAKNLRRPALIDEGRGGRELKLLPVPSRIDNSESEAIDQFMADFEKRLGPFAPPELTFENGLFIDLKVPYVPAYAFRETVAMRESERAVATELIAAYTRLTAAIVALAPTASRLFRVYHGGVRKGEGQEVAPAEQFFGREWVLERVDRWLADEKSPMLLITGPPGAGKTAVVRWLAQQFAARASEAATVGERDGSAEVAYVHLCDTYDERSLDARNFVEVLAKRIDSLVPQYAAALLSARHSEIEIEVEVKQSISATEAGGLAVGDVSVGRVSARRAFDELVRRPLAEVTLAGPLLVLVDGIEAALAGRQFEELIEVLEHASHRGPRGLRFLLTSRADPRILKNFGANRLDLLTDAPSDADDIRTYAEVRLAHLPPEERAHHVVHIVDRSAGNFLFARLAIEEIQKGRGEEFVRAVEGDLNKYYAAELRRLLAPDLELSPDDAIFFAVLAVAGEPLDRAQLSQILQDSASGLDERLRRFSQFLVVDSAGRTEIFHGSFRDFLEHEPKVSVRVSDARVAILMFLSDEISRGPSAPSYDYALRWALAHLLAALEETSQPAERSELASLIGEIALDPAFLATKVARLGPAALASDLDAAARVIPGLTGDPRVGDRIAAGLTAISEGLALATLPDPDGAEAFAAGLLHAFAEYVADAYASAYEALREEMPSGPQRTRAMNSLLQQVRVLAEASGGIPLDVPAMLKGTPGERIVGLGILQVRPDSDVFDDVTIAIGDSKSAFEQYHALEAAKRLLPLVGESERMRLVEVLTLEREGGRGFNIRNDQSRWTLMNDLLLQLLEEGRASV